MQGLHIACGGDRGIAAAWTAIQGGASLSAIRVVLLTCVFLATAACDVSLPTNESPPAPEENVLAIESVRLTAAGHFVDLRYRVADPERANEILGPGIKPRLIDEATGTVMEVPMTAKLGPLRQTRGEQRTGRSYFVLFANNAGLEPGSVVAAELGDLRFEGLIVQ